MCHHLFVAGLSQQCIPASGVGGRSQDRNWQPQPQRLIYRTHSFALWDDIPLAFLNFLYISPEKTKRVQCLRVSTRAICRKRKIALMEGFLLFLGDVSSTY